MKSVAGASRDGVAFSAVFLHEIGDPLDDNIDVEIRLASGERHAATFFTLANLQTTMARYEASGACLAGQYLWAVDMIIVRELTEAIVMRTIGDLIDTGELASACQSLVPIDADE